MIVLRPIDNDHVEVIKASINNEVFCSQSAYVLSATECIHLVIGAHRLAALKKPRPDRSDHRGRGPDRRTSDFAAKVDEIDENLARHELNALDRTLFLAQRKDFYLLANPDAAAGGDRRSKRLTYDENFKCSKRPFDLPKGFGAQAEKKVGLSRVTI